MNKLGWVEYEELCRSRRVLSTKAEGRGGCIPVILFSKIQLVVYYQCCILIGWATTRLYVIAN